MHVSSICGHCGTNKTRGIPISGCTVYCSDTELRIAHLTCLSHYVHRMYASNIEADWKELGAAHAEVFKASGAKPCATLVGASLLMPWMKVEIEVTACVIRILLTRVNSIVCRIFNRRIRSVFLV